MNTTNIAKQTIEGVNPISDSEETQEIKSNFPVWASKEHKPSFVYGEEVDNPNLFVPPGYQDEVIVKYGDYTRHPDESKFVKYGMCVLGSMDLQRQFESFMDSCTDEEMESFSNSAFIRNTEATAEAFDAIKVGHVIGTMRINDPIHSYALEVLKILEGKDTIVCRPWFGEIKSVKYKKPSNYIPEDPEFGPEYIYLTFEDVSFALAMEQFKILYYKNFDILDEELGKNPKENKYIFKPYGFDDLKKEYKIRGRYRIAENNPGYVPDDELEEKYNTAWQQHVEAMQAKATEGKESL